MQALSRMFRRLRLAPTLVLVLAPIVALGLGAFALHRVFSKRAHPPARQEQAQPTPEVAKAAPDPLQKPFEEVARLIGGGQLAAAREQILKALAEPPDSKLVPEMRSLLGELNITLFLNDPNDARHATHTVGSGDTIVGVARKASCTPEMILLLNGLQNTTIRKGQALLIPKAQFSLAIDPQGKEAILLCDGYLFKSYPLARCQLPPSHKGAFETQISKKLSWKTGKQIAFGDPVYVDAARQVGLATPGYTLHTAQEDPARDVAQPNTGFGFAPGDLDELYAFLVQGAAVRVLN